MKEYNALSNLTPLQKGPRCCRGLNAFCKPQDVAFSKGASGSCRNGSACISKLMGDTKGTFLLIEMTSWGMLKDEMAILEKKSTFFCIPIRE